jgi:hypothetical protein
MTERTDGDRSRILNHVVASRVSTFADIGRFDAARRDAQFTVRFGGTVTDASGNIRIAFHADASSPDFGCTYKPRKKAEGIFVGRTSRSKSTPRRSDSFMSFLAASQPRVRLSDKKEATHAR